MHPERWCVGDAMGNFLSCRDRAIPAAEDLGLPKAFKVIRVVGQLGGDTALLIRRKLPSGRTEEFAAKVLPRGNIIDCDALLKGIRNHSRLNHIHIVRLLGLILTPTHLLLQLQDWNGGELYDYLQKQHPVTRTQLLSEEHARFFFLQLVYALHHCHEQKVAHRNIKFANIVLDGKKTPILKVCEFGLSKSWDASEDCKSFTTVGTPLYMSPEVLNIHVGSKREPYDPRKSDIWGLGVILFTMLFGRFPFIPAHSEVGLMRGNLVTGSFATFDALPQSVQKVHRSEPGRLKSEIWSSPDLSEDCKNLLESMLVLDPSRRITLTQIIHHRWVCGPLLLEHAQCIAKCREEMELPDYVPPTCGLGTPNDDDLMRIIKRSMRQDDPCSPLTFWVPPKVKSSAQKPGGPDVSEPSFSALYQNYRSCVTASC